MDNYYIIEDDGNWQLWELLNGEDVWLASFNSKATAQYILEAIQRLGVE